jgi:hypothetical protein
LHGSSASSSGTERLCAVSICRLPPSALRVEWPLVEGEFDPVRVRTDIMNATRISTAFALALALASTGCDDPEPLLEQQADEVCACDDFECGMKVLEGPINQKLKAMDEGGKVELSDKAKADKKRMMTCLLDLKAKDLGGGDTKTAKAPAPKTGSKAPAYRSAEGRFSVRFPYGKPKLETKKDPKGIAWKEAKSDIGMYTVAYSDFASQAAAQKYVDGFIKTMHREIKSNGEASVGDEKGREVTMKVSERATLWLRMFVVGKRVYKVAAGTKNDKTKAYAFLDTFALVGS